MSNDKLELTSSDIADAADFLNLTPCIIKAVYKVESSGQGFWAPEKPKILFEGHVFWRELKKRGISPEKYASHNPHILYPTWDRAHYLKGIAEYQRLEQACAIHEEAALCSASWGLFQIMGNNFSACGFSDVFEFVKAHKCSESSQLKAFCSFLKSQNLVGLLQACNWSEFARRYNGPAYKQNQYDQKLQREYETCRKSSIVQ